MINTLFPAFYTDGVFNGKNMHIPINWNNEVSGENRCKVRENITDIQYANNGTNEDWELPLKFDVTMEVPLGSGELVYQFFAIPDYKTFKFVSVNDGKAQVQFAASAICRPDPDDENWCELANKALAAGFDGDEEDLEDLLDDHLCEGAIQELQYFFYKKGEPLEVSSGILESVEEITDALNEKLGKNFYDAELEELTPVLEKIGREYWYDMDVYTFEDYVLITIPHED